MANPRYISKEGVPTPELLEKMEHAKTVMYANLNWFCEKWAQDARELGKVDQIFLIGSHANETGWKNETSDLDLKIVNGSELVMPDYLLKFKKEVLRPLLCVGEKNRWIDLYFVKEEYQVLTPRWDLTPHWKRLEVPGQFE